MPMNDTHIVLITLFLIEHRRLAKYAVVVKQDEIGFDFYDSLQYYGEHADNWIALTQANTDAELINVELIEGDLFNMAHPDPKPLNLLKGEELETFQGPTTVKELSQELGRLLQIEYQESTVSHAGLYTDSDDEDIKLDGQITHQRLGELILKALTANAPMKGPTKQQTLGEANTPRTDQEFIDSLESTTKKGEFKFTPDNPPSLDEIDTLRKMEAKSNPSHPFHMPIGPTHTQPNGTDWQQWEVDTDNTVSHYWECINPDGTKDRYPSDLHGWIDAYKHPCASIGLRVIVDSHHQGEEQQVRTDQCVRLPDMGIDPWLKFRTINLSRWMPQPQIPANNDSQQ